MSHSKEDSNSKKIPFYIQRKLAKAGKKLKSDKNKEEEKEKVKLLSGNYEIKEILSDLINNYYSDLSGRYLIKHSAFKYLTRLFEHQEEKLNYLKYRGVVEHLNLIAKEKK